MNVIYVMMMMPIVIGVNKNICLKKKHVNLYEFDWFKSAKKRNKNIFFCSLYRKYYDFYRFF